MKGKLLIEPGFEAGSLYCGGCKHLKEIGRLGFESSACNQYSLTLKIDRGPIGENYGALRLQQCLDAEVKNDQD